MSSPDPFSARFDAIDVDPARKPSAEAIDSALSLCAPAGGFELLDDAGGRFAVDPQLGVISVVSDAILTRDAGQTHTVRLRTTEASGACYDLDIPLKITGRVPQMLGVEDFGALASLAADVAPAPVVKVELPPTPFTRYAAMQGMGVSSPLGSERAPYGALLSVDLSRSIAAGTELRLRDALPAPSRADTHWDV
jgi:hypothetical protein